MLKDLLFKLTAVLMLVSMTNLVNGQGMSCDMAEVVTVGTYTLTDTIPSNGSNTNASAAPGVADGAVWYSYTPTETGSISVNSCLGGADTRLFVYAGACDALVPVALNDDACLLLEGGTDAYASSVEGVTVIGGLTYYIEWDNNWENTAFTWNLSFEPLPAADVAVAAAQQFLNLPDSQTDLIGLVGNFGSQALTGVVLTADVFAAADLTTPLVTVSGAAIDLAVAETATVNAGSWTPVDGESYVITYSAVATEVEEASEMGNNSEQGQAFNVTDLVYTLEEGAATVNLGVNAGGELNQLNQFSFYGADTLTSVFTSYTGGPAGDMVDLVIHAQDPATGLPGELVYTQVAPLDAGEKTITLDTEFPVASGEVYYIGIHSVTVGNIGVGLTETYAYPGVSVLNINGGAWGTLEGVGFPGTYVVRLNMKGEAADPVVTLNVNMSNETVSAEGVYVAGSFNGWDATATQMSDDDGDGVYSVSVTVPLGSDIQYKFLNGPSYDFEENVLAACGIDNGQGGFNRLLTGINLNVDVTAVCFSACQGCFPAAPEVAPCDANAGTLICDNFDGYTLGSVSDQADWWTPWPGGGSAEVSDAFAQSGANSMVIAGGGTTDQILLFPSNATEGTYYVSWSYYVPTGGAAYFNLQGDRDDIGGIFKMECNMTGEGAGTVTVAGVATAFSYPEDTWFNVNMVIDLDAAEATIYVAGSGVSTWDFTNDAAAAGGVSQVGGVNFFPIDAGYTAYVDNVSVVGPTTELALTVGTSSIDVDAAGMFLAGDFNGWSNGEMSNNGNDTWSATVTVTANQTHEYKFKNGDSGWEDGIVGDCVLDNGNRFVEVGGGATEVDEVCFLSCTAICLSNTQDVAFDAGITVTPNPTSGVFSVNYELDAASDLEIRIMNVLGQTVSVRTVDAATAGAENFDLTNFAAGTYTLVTTSNDRLSTKRIILQ